MSSEKPNLAARIRALRAQHEKRAERTGAAPAASGTASTAIQVAEPDLGEPIESIMVRVHDGARSAAGGVHWGVPPRSVRQRGGWHR